nr:MAG TPA: hypothetical protein [Caudoviricetes sp.]
MLRKNLGNRGFLLLCCYREIQHLLKLNQI